MILPPPFRGKSRTWLDAQEFPVNEIQYFFMSASLKGPTASQIPLFIVFPSLGSRCMKEWERQNDLNLFLPSWQEFQSMHLSVTASDNGWQLQSHGVVPRACLHESGPWYPMHCPIHSSKLEYEILLLLCHFITCHLICPMSAACLSLLLSEESQSVK